MKAWIAVLIAVPAVALAQAETWPLMRAWGQGMRIDPAPKGAPQGSLAAREARGKELFGPLCVRCHGFDGRGGGAAGVGMTPPPANLVDKPVRFRTTPADAKPAEADLFRTITGGLRGTGMPAFADLPESERWALAAYVRSIQPGADAPAHKIPPPPKDLDSPDRAERARPLAQSCLACHGAGSTTAPAFAEKPRRRPDPEALFSAIRYGIPGTQMQGRGLPDEVIWDLVSFVRAQSPSGQHPAEREAVEQIVDSCEAPPPPAQQEASK